MLASAYWSTVLAWWFLFFWSVPISASSNSGILQVDLVFPRNETYKPTLLMPIVFAVRGIELAKFILPTLSFEVWDQTADKPTGPGGNSWKLATINASAKDTVYFQYEGRTWFNTAGIWQITWHLDWTNCTEDSISEAMVTGDRLDTRNTNHGTTFTTSANSTREADIFTTDDQTCWNFTGSAINITRTLPMSSNLIWGEGYSGSCGVLSPVYPCGVSGEGSWNVQCPVSNSLNPCGGKVDAAAAASISAVITSKACKYSSLAELSCPAAGDESAAQRLAVAGVVSLATIFGGLFYYHILV